MSFSRRDFFFLLRKCYLKARRRGKGPVGPRPRPHSRAADPRRGPLSSVLHLQAEHDLLRARLRGGEARIVELRIHETDFSVGSVEKVVHPEICGLAGRAAQATIEFLAAEEGLNLPPGHFARQEQCAAHQEGLAGDLPAADVRARAVDRSWIRVAPSDPAD